MTYYLPAYHKTNFINTLVLYIVGVGFTGLLTTHKDS